MPKAMMKKYNFWNDVRVKANCRYTDLAELLGRSPSYCSMIFSGEYMPIDSIIQKLCDFFDVDFETGKAEFEKAHNAWYSLGRGGGKMLASTGSNAGYKHKPKDEVVIGFMDIIDAIAEVIYGKVDYSAFSEFMASVKSGEAKYNLVYGKISFDEFIALTKLVNSLV